MREPASQRAGIPTPGESGVRQVHRLDPDAVGCVSRSDFLMACEPRHNPNGPQFEAQALTLARQLGLLRSTNSRRFDAFNSIAAYTYPTASVERGLANAQWSNWLFFFDDMHDEDLERCRDTMRVERSIERHLQLLRYGGSVRMISPLERLTLDLHARLLSLGGEQWLERFCTSAAEYLKLGVLPAVRNWADGQTPDLDSYLIQREYDCSMYACIDMIEIAEDIHVPDEIRDSETMKRARRACARTVGYFNDIVSYPKEVLKSHNPNNLVHVLVSDQGLTVRQAVLRATDIVNACTRDLLVAEQELLGTGGTHSQAVATYLQGMKNWQRGNVEWSLEGGRYAAPGSPMVELNIPLG